MATIIDKLEKAQLRRVPSFDAGDRVRVHFQVIEGSRRRTQVFEGIVLKRQGSGVRETFTVRKQSFGVGVERTFPVHSTKIEKIEVAARGEVRRAKLYYLRDRVGKRARVRERAWTPTEQARLDAEMAVAYDEQGPQDEAELVAPSADEGAAEGSETSGGDAETAAVADAAESTEAQPADSQPTEAQSSDSQPDEAQPEEPRPADSQPEDAQSEEAQSEEPQSADSQPADSQPAEPGEAAAEPATSESDAVASPEEADDASADEAQTQQEPAAEDSP